MGRRGKLVKRKVQGKRSARSPGKNGSPRDLQKRLADVLGQLQTRDRELGETFEPQTAVGRHGSRPVNPH